MGMFDGYLLVSDFDGTLIDDKWSISRDNTLAIESFVAQGGRFLGATGRTELNVRPYTGDIALTTPWILYNGAAIYDWQESAFIYKAPLDRQLTEAFVTKVMARFATVNIQVFPGGPFAQINSGALPDAVAVREGQHYENRPMDQVSRDWLKILFCSDVAEELLAIEAMLGDDPLSAEVHKTHSGRRYFELTARGVNKGSALAHLKALLQPTPRHVVAIGDYLNDIEMLQEADTAAAPQSAMPEVKSHAQIITASHTQSAIADLVAKLEDRYA
ncbi:MAG: HAD-superfamily hydrolase, subfamily [Proteobacteria bacterium]|nr:HAD-superfamily hydrolase, subfamily [Pseudomonadota bacterium]